jgi:hypothetical protein
VQQAVDAAIADAADGAEVRHILEARLGTGIGSGRS